MTGRYLVKNVLKICKRCRYFGKKPANTDMVSVSTDNLKTAPAFYGTQVDLCGPFRASIFFYLDFFHNHSRTTELQGKGGDISLTPHYHFHPLHRHLDISWTITAGSSPLHIGSSRT